MLCTTVPAGADEPGKVSLRGAVLDAGSGEPLAARVYIQGADKSWHFARSAGPTGSAVTYNKRRPEFNSFEVHTTLSAHPFTADLPPGKYTVTVERGKEYRPLVREVTLGSKPLDVEFKLERWVDAARLGWYSGDTHVHRPLEELPNVMLAEDLNVAFPLLHWVHDAFTPPGKGRPGGDADPGRLVKVDAMHVIWPRNTEYEIFTVDKKPHTLGAFFVINHRTLLEDGAPPVGSIARKAHGEGALIELDKHNWPWSMALVPVMPVDLFELSNNHVWRTEFAFRGYGEAAGEYMKVERDDKGWTEWGWLDFGFQNYYALLNCGFRLRPTAGTASGVHPVPLGFGRVYVRLPNGFNYEDWLKGLNAGRSFITTGPMLFVTLDGQPPGSTLRPTGAATYRLSGTALSGVPLQRIEIIVNGEVTTTLEPENRKTQTGAFETRINEQVPLESSSWVAVRCFEDRPDKRVRFAHSSPVHVEFAGRPLRPRKAEVEYLIARVEAQIERSGKVLPPAAIDEYRRALDAYRAIAKTAK